MEKDTLKNASINAYTELEQGIYIALETYSNVHRGSGLNSMLSTHLFDQARDIILEYLGLNKSKYCLIFCTARRATDIKAQLEPDSYQCISSQDIGLTLTVWALAVKRNALPKGAPTQSGGGTTRLISKDWVIWANAPDKFEAGTPAIINIIAFAKAVLLIKQYGKDIFKNPAAENLTATDILYHDELEKYSGKELLDELRKTLIGKAVKVPTMEGEKPFINMDNSASTPTFNPIWDAFRQTWQQPAQIKQEVIQEVKTICGSMLGAPLSDYDVIFTSNTTEAINLTAESLSRESDDTEPVVLNSLFEHSSNDLPWRMIPGCSLVRLSVDRDGFVDLKELENILIEYNQNGKFGNKRIKLVALSAASNVLGICNNMQEISRIVHQYGAKLLVDAAQLVAHRKLDINGIGIDYVAFSAHKIYAPFGCGVLICRKGLFNFNSEELEQIRLSGEENAAGIAALGKALVLLQRIGMDLISKEEQALTKRLLNGMAQISGMRIYGLKDIESPGFAHKIGVVVFGMKNIMPNKLASELVLQGGIGIRYGCHCAHIIIKHLLKTPPFIERLQRLIVTLFPKLSLPGLVRVSLGIENTEEDVDTLIKVLRKIANKSTKSDNSHTPATPFFSKTDVKKQMNDFVKSSAMRVYSEL